MKHKLKIVSLIQALGLTAYISLVALFMQNAENWFGPQKGNEMFGIMIFLLIFVISALISASIMLGYPATLFFQGKRKTALNIVLQSVGWLVLFLVLIIIFTLNK
jgi:hypothetical protein